MGLLDSYANGANFQGSFGLMTQKLPRNNIQNLNCVQKLPFWILKVCTVLRSKMAILGLKMSFLDLYTNCTFSRFFWTHDTTITHELYIESQLCSKLTILNTQSPALLSKMDRGEGKVTIQSSMETSNNTITW